MSKHRPWADGPDFLFEEIEDKGGVELYFPGIPLKPLREQMSAMGWRWNGTYGVWWIRKSDEALSFANELADRNRHQPLQVENHA